MSPNETMELVYGTLISVAEAATEEEDLLEPNGVMLGIMRFYMEMFDATGWEDDPRESLLDFYDAWIEALNG